MRIVKVGESYICPVCGKYTFEYGFCVRMTSRLRRKKKKPNRGKYSALMGLR